MTEGVEFTGRVNPYPYYRAASIICSTSITESFGLTLVEGMQHRAVPVAFQSSPAIGDVVGRSGLLVKPYYKRRFAQELAQLMDDDAGRDFRAEKCRIASRQYDEENIVVLWQKLFEVGVCKNHHAE